MSAQEKVILLNPFQARDDEIFDKVYRTHFHCSEKCDVVSLYSVASNVVNHSIQMTDRIIKSSYTDQTREDTTASLRLQTVKRIACQMICTPRGEEYTHHTTMVILEQLKGYSWDAKAMIALAAFAMEYGKFWHIPLTQRDQLGNSLSVLNGLQGIQGKTQDLNKFSSLVKKAMEMIECINEWKSIVASGYDINNLTALSDILQEIPMAVHWTIMTFVTCASHINFIVEKDYKYDQSNLDAKLGEILSDFKKNLEKCNEQRGNADDYRRRKVIVTRKGKDIVHVLRALIIPSDTQGSKPVVVINGLTQEKVEIEEFRKKYVLLFISGLDKIEEDTRHLKTILDRLKEGPKEVDGYKKEDFKILWIPIVDDWNDQNHKGKIKEVSNKIGCYAVKEFDFSTGKRLIEEVFEYNGTPIIPLISPEGKVVNKDAKPIISLWGIDGFPFRASDYKRLTEQWKWFWDEITKLSPPIKELIEKDKDRYIFIYGGTDGEWFKKFNTAIQELKGHPTIIDEAIEIEVHQVAKDNAKFVIPRFWIGMDNLLASRKQQIMKGGDELSDFATRQMKKLMSLKKDPQGWVLLSKGSNAKVLGQGEAMYRTVKDFEEWSKKLTGQEGVSFDVAFKEYYESKVEDVAHKCEEKELANYCTDVLERISCPNPNCGRFMGVDSVKYKCCHGHNEPGNVLDSVTQSKANP